MKKLVCLIAALSLISLAFTASAGSLDKMEKMSNSQMNDVTAQAGVSIGIDDFDIYQNIGKMAYADPLGPGEDPSEGGGAIVIDGFEAQVYVNAISGTNSTGVEGMGDVLFKGTYGDAWTDPGLTQFQPLTFDVGESEIVPGSVECVKIGVPSIEMYTSSLAFDVGVNGDTNLSDGISDISNDQTFGTFGLQDVTMAVNKGDMEIAPH